MAFIVKDCATSSKKQQTDRWRHTSGRTYDQETGGLKPVSALVDPARIGLGYRGSLTGDYDLWGVFSKVENYDR
jgi:hypothetical protein